MPFRQKCDRIRAPAFDGGFFVSNMTLMALYRHHFPWFQRYRKRHFIALRNGFSFLAVTPRMDNRMPCRNITISTFGKTAPKSHIKRLRGSHARLPFIHIQGHSRQFSSNVHFAHSHFEFGNWRWKHLPNAHLRSLRRLWRPIS